MEVVFRNVSKQYGSVTAVSNLNLTIAKGSFHFLLGPSGCGKTTTLRLLAGLENISSGQIFFNGKDLTNKPASERGIGMVFQNYALWPHMTVRQNIEYGLKLRKLTNQEISNRVGDVLDLTRLTKFEKRLPGQLSGGQQQRVALARALAIRPTVLLLDEPLSNLDAKLRMEKEALSMGTTITVMHHGVEVQTGPPRDLYSDPSTAFLAAFIGETNLIDGVFLEHLSDGALVQTEFARLKATKVHGDPKKGDKVSLSIRPGDFKVYPNASDLTEDRSNILHLKLGFSTYLGEIEQLGFPYQKDKVLKIDLHNPKTQLASGTLIKCMVEPNDVIVLPFEEIES